MKTLQTPVKWRLGFKGTEHTFTGYKSRTVTDAMNDFARWYYRNHRAYKDFGHALEQYIQIAIARGINVLPKELKMLRHNMIERIKVFYWSEKPDLEYFQLTEEVIKYGKLDEEDFCFFLHQCAGSPVRNDFALTNQPTNDNAGFV